MASRKELINDEQEALRMAMDGRLSSLWTALPGIIAKVDFSKMTCEVQPAIQGTMEDEQGNTKNVNLPLLVDVPIVFPSAGGFTLTFPLKAGDEVLVIIASRCIDTWWDLGGVGVPAEARMHDLSDGFAIPGPKSQVKKISNISSTNAQLRNDSGDTYLEITASGSIKIKSSSIAEIEAATINLKGNVNVTGTTVLTGAVGVVGALSTTGGVSVAGVNFGTHVHTLVQPGLYNSGGPIS